MKAALSRNLANGEETRAPADNQAASVRQQLESLQRITPQEVLGPHVQNLFANLQ